MLESPVATALMNRESEAAFLEKLNEGIAKGTSWERVTDLIQLENSREFHTFIISLYLLASSRIPDQLGIWYFRISLMTESKTIRPSVPGGSDLARMKEILLALKREGDKAPGAGGF
jgi:hypothetical protein